MKAIVIPEGVTRIGIGAFCGCSALESVVIPGSVKDIDPSAFNGCTPIKIGISVEMS